MYFLSSGSFRNRIGIDAAPLDPQLQPLGDYGGPTQTHKPLPTSPAINAGDAAITSAPSFDQRGGPFHRVVGRIDMGSVEDEPFTDTYIVDIEQTRMTGIWALETCRCES